MIPALFLRFLRPEYGHSSYASLFFCIITWGSSIMVSSADGLKPIFQVAFLRMFFVVSLQIKMIAILQLFTVERTRFI